MARVHKSRLLLATALSSLFATAAWSQTVPLASIELAMVAREAAMNPAMLDEVVVTAPPVFDELTPRSIPLLQDPPLAQDPPPAPEPQARDPFDWLPWRRRPGRVETYPDPVEQVNEGAVRAPPPEAFPTDHLPIPDRWRLIEEVGVKERWFDPYNQNTLKGDRPIWGSDDKFIAVTAISDTVIEPRSFPIPVGVQTTEDPGSLDVFGRADSLVVSQTLVAGVAFVEGSTAFKPPHLEARLALALNYSYVDVPERRVLSVLPSRDSRREDSFIGVQEAFIDYHLRDVSARYDFDSIRVGIQPFNADFRGFLFQDNQLGVRLFGNRDNNRIQYNLAAFARVEKDTNSGLNDIGQPIRDDQVFIANVYRQDFLIPGLTSQLTLIYNRNREADDVQIDDNGFPVRPALLGDLRPRDYDVLYVGYSADGRWGRMNLSATTYGAFGEDRNSVFTSQPADIRAFFAAIEPSFDLDWMRFRGSFLYASGDSDPFDDVEEGFDAIFENPQFAGADTSYWVRQTIPFAGGGRAISINGRNGVLNSLRSSKEEGQSNFNNPGTVLLGVGADFDLTPELKVVGNLNHIWFEDTSTIQVLRNEGSIPTDLGFDVSVGAIWRPFMTQNVVLRGSAAMFEPGDGFGDLFTDSRRDDRYYSVLLNATLSF